MPKFWMIGAAVSLLATSAFADVPLSRSASGHVTVPIVINGAGPFSFVIDSGAEGSAVYARFAEEQRLPSSAENETVVGQTGAADLPLVILRTLEVDGSTARDIAAVRLDDRKDGVPLAGILGLDVMGQMTVDFDFRRARVALHPTPPVDQLPDGRQRAIRAERVLGGLLAIPVLVNGARGIAVIDTGARETRLNRAFAAAANLKLDPDGKSTTIHGATNSAVELLPARAKSIEFAGIVLKDRPIRIVDLPVFKQLGLADRPAMLLGADYLTNQRMIIDFKDGLIWFL